MLKIQAKIFENNLKISFERLCEFSIFYEILRNSRIPKKVFFGILEFKLEFLRDITRNSRIQKRYY